MHLDLGCWWIWAIFYCFLFNWLIYCSITSLLIIKLTMLTRILWIICNIWQNLILKQRTNILVPWNILLNSILLGWYWMMSHLWTMRGRSTWSNLKNYSLSSRTHFTPKTLINHPRLRLAIEFQIMGSTSITILRTLMSFLPTSFLNEIKVRRKSYFNGSFG